MTTAPLSQHISQQFDKELEDIRGRVLKMGGMVEEQLALALEALSSNDSEKAAIVTTSDYKVNALEVSIDEECIQILARRQPAASDLRLVVAVIKTITDLERIGDEAEKIGRMVQRVIETGVPSSYSIGALSMGHHVREMLHAALDAFARMDPQAAFKVASEDLKIDQEYDATMRQLITYMMEDPRSITQVMDFAWVVRALERIGDHANNICEYVIYLVEGKDVRHISLEDMEKEIQTD